MEWIIGIVDVFVTALQWPRKGRWGINTKPVACPQCEAELPRARKPANLKQAFWGGWTCPDCGCECDKYGRAQNA